MSHTHGEHQQFTGRVFSLSIVGEMKCFSCVAVQCHVTFGKPFVFIVLMQCLSLLDKQLATHGLLEV